jgi:hypothetical protein
MIINRKCLHNKQILDDQKEYERLLKCYNDDNFVRHHIERKPKFEHKINPNEMHGECITIRGGSR